MDTRKRTVRLRPKNLSLATPSVSDRVAVFTAVDDGRTLERRMTQRLRGAGVPVIPVSTMTLEEIAPIAAEHRLQQAMIVEAGGVIAHWTNDGWHVEPCGPSADTLLDVITRIEDRSGASLYVWSVLDETERQFSAPFTIESGDLKSIRRAAAKLGFAVLRGNEHLHLRRECDQGEAFTRLREDLGCEIAIGIGASPIDAEFLSRVDVPIIVPGPDGTADAELLASVPAARIASSWAAAVDESLRSVAAPRRRVRRVAS